MTAVPLVWLPPATSAHRPDPCPLRTAPASPVPQLTIPAVYGQTMDTKPPRCAIGTDRVSALVTTYVGPVAPVIGPQLMPLESQRRHWYV